VTCLELVSFGQLGSARRAARINQRDALCVAESVFDCIFAGNVKDGGYNVAVTGFATGYASSVLCSSANMAAGSLCAAVPGLEHRHARALVLRLLTPTELVPDEGFGSAIASLQLGDDASAAVALSALCGRAGT
jgi:hypothetical protein